MRQKERIIMKKIVTLLLAAALMSVNVAFAESTPELITANPDTNIEQISRPEVKAGMFTKITAGAAKLSKLSDDATLIEAIDSNDQEVSFVVGSETLVVDSEGKAAEIKEGMQFTTYTYWNEPTVLMLPPRYNPAVIVVENGVGDMANDAGAFKKDADSDRYVNSENTLSIVAGDETEVVDRKGDKFEGDLDGKDLLVFYTISTRSIPAQTTPEKIIVIADSGALLPEEAETASGLETVKKIKIGDSEFDTKEINGANMVAVRPVSEALELEIAWNNDTKTVSIGTIQMGVNFQIGENKYSKAKMAAAELSAAPYLEQTADGGVTYVPVEFFTEIIGCDAVVADAVATLS